MGFPSPAADYVEERIDLNALLVPKPLSTFYFRYTGACMREAFIPSGSLLVVDRSVTATDGSIVVAVVEGEFYVRYFYKAATGYTLVPAAKKYKSIEVTEGMNACVWGVVTGIIHQPNQTI